MEHAGDPNMQSEVRAIIEHVLADRPGDWRVSIMGSQANDRWELKIMGPNGIHVGHKYVGMANCCEALLRPLLLDAKVCANCSTMTGMFVQPFTALRRPRTN